MTKNCPFFQVLRYINRLSDFLFTVARLASRLEKRAETIYVRPDTRENKVAYQEGPDGVWKKEKGNKNV